ncbi:MAG: hypothetical protein KC766_35155 [Myxococcales bacterium]|nr:hypothetical protein [Myxococcales bacterium]
MRLVDSPPALERTAKELAGAEQLFIDTEFESTREHRTLCLLQISRGETIYLVDTLRLGNLSALAPVLEAEATEWVLHAGQQDVLLLLERFKLKRTPPIFDTQIAWGLLGPEPSVSLAYLQFRVLGLRAGKAHQADDWKRRPLPQSQLEYAAGDIAHLPELRAELGARLRSKQREQCVFDAGRDALVPSDDPPPELNLDSFRNAWQLEPPNQAALRALMDWYNGLPAHKRAQAPAPKTLLAIAGRLPEEGQDVARIKGVPMGWGRRYGDQIAALVVKAVNGARAGDFVPIDPPPYATFEEIRLDAYFATLRAEVCAMLQVAPELAMPTRVLRRLRAALLAGGTGEALAELEGWRADLCRAAVAEHLETHPPPLGS